MIPLVAVSPGQTLDGIVELVNVGADNTFDYNSRFSNIDGTSLNVIGGPEISVATLTLEAYSVNFASDYPTGSTVFSQTSLKLPNGVSQNIAWSTVNDDGDGLSATVNVDGSENARSHTKAVVSEHCNIFISQTLNTNNDASTRD